MKIAQVVSLETDVPPRSQNGLEFIVSWITEELVRRGHEVTLFAPEHSQTSAKLVSVLPNELSHVTNKPWQQPVRSLWNTTLVASRAKEFDVIHSHTGTITFSLPFITTPVIETLHHPIEQSPWLSLFDKESYKTVMSFVLEQYQKIHYVAVSKNQEKSFKQAPDFFKKLTSISNGIPVTQFEFSAQPKDYLLYIGYINKQKGADVAIRIAQALGMKLILAGNVYAEESFFNEQIKPHLSDKITYVGTVDFKQKVELYKNAVATLAPIQWDEPFGLTLIESQACGTPVIAFNRGAAPEIIKDGETGFVVSTQEEMCAAVKKISSIDRSACRAWVEKNFSVERMVDEYEALYKKIVSEQ